MLEATPLLQIGVSFQNEQALPDCASKAVTSGKGRRVEQHACHWRPATTLAFRVERCVGAILPRVLWSLRQAAVRTTLGEILASVICGYGQRT